MGRRTVSAISSFQRQSRMSVDGKASQDVLLAIRKAENDGSRAATPSSTTHTSATRSSRRWYYVRPEIGRVMKSLRRLLARSDDTALRSGVTELVSRTRWPWNEQVFRDDFKKSASQGGLDWRVLRGEYSIRDGLLSDARNQPTTAPSSSSRRLGKEQMIDILGALLGAQREQGVSSQDAPAATRRGQSDEIHLAAVTSERFLMRARVQVQDNSRGMAFALQRTVNGAAEEVRMRYRSKRQTLNIEHVTSAGMRDIASVSAPLHPGQHYSIEWTRSRDGRMQVALNGQLVITDARTDLRGGFDSFVWRNNGGSYLMSEVEMHTRR
jgi:hypothetical protein